MNRLLKFRVRRKTLIITAGFVWIIAGGNILKIGVLTGLKDPSRWSEEALGAILIFGVFFFLIFKRMFVKHTLRIALKDDQNHPLAFFDAKGWIVMGFMMTLGITIRAFHLLPDWFIAFFYTGLSIALILTGSLFLFHLRKIPY
jgi:hypothetical protein